MRASTANVFIFFCCAFLACVFIRLKDEGAASAQLMFPAMAEEILRLFLSTRLGYAVDVLAVAAAAAPLDFLLNNMSPSWPLLAVGPCDKRRHKMTDYGGCAALHAHACYDRGASYGVDLESMAICHNSLGVSAGEAKRHYLQCHTPEELPWAGTRACMGSELKVVKETGNRQRFLEAMIMCATRYRVKEEFIEEIKALDNVQVRELPSGEGGEQTYNIAIS